LYSNEGFDTNLSKKYKKLANWSIELLHNENSYSGRTKQAKGPPVWHTCTWFKVITLSDFHCTYKCANSKVVGNVFLFFVDFFLLLGFLIGNDSSVVNFTNILGAITFSQILFYHKKIQTQTNYRKTEHNTFIQKSCS